ncbi:TPA: hypothetical protein ACOELX_003197 [Enterobacter roggenkampii]|jgi:hypothetical protein|uniref:Uncharacterized protein n=1 Tax=Citrobacter portucalensis TaxID=1639133 RepID=A0ABZ0H4T9_9ENTR|nr:MULTISPECIES: hypothetical protein [Enterobacteriaceae]GJK13934.1 hypothetical protein TUM16664_17070 [Enterobacter cloacae]HCR0838700.1 hypothetical protein [Enterobacter cancerogenus]HDS4771220.1 hypothetical protein [Enterobacter hormaechei subsp. steigerwaltii]EIY3123378.1 hypothetical protein [Escherichia coli]MBJ9034580.1 hypothetical protein [Citrobacter freundii]
MGEWLLIITLIGTSGVAIEKANFSTEEACLKAAKAWNDDVKKMTRDTYQVCVKTSGAG